MSGDMSELILIEDLLEAGATLALPGPDAARVVYVVHGAMSIGGTSFTDDQAWFGKGAATMTAGPAGAALWRFELLPKGARPATIVGGHGRSAVKLARSLDGLRADAVLMRGDAVAFPPGGCAYLHTHQGPGIRCLVEGGIRIDAEGHAISYGPGGAWFESGPDPVFAQAAADRPSRFVRVMVLPARLKGQSSIQYVRAEDRDKPKSQKYKIYVDELI